jgi:hypothetical protein
MTDFEHTLIGLLRFAVMSAALTYYWTQSGLFFPVRRLLRGSSASAFGSYLVYCPSCVGTWVGLALYLIGIWPLHGGAAWQEALLAMFASCVVNRVMPHDNLDYEINEWVTRDQTKEGEDGKN